MSDDPHDDDDLESWLVSSDTSRPAPSRTDSGIGAVAVVAPATTDPTALWLAAVAFCASVLGLGIAIVATILLG